MCWANRDAVRDVSNVPWSHAPDNQGVEDMGFHKEQFRELIQNVLNELTLVIPYSDVARELLMLTAAVESNLGVFLKQIRGPALGVFQMEPNTEKDIWKNYLATRSNLRILMEGFMMQSTSTPNLDLRANLPYQIAMARVHYRRVSEPLPPRATPALLGAYWKKHYNTHLGRGTVEESIKKYEWLC
jgi:hypothetical protein